MFQMTIVVCKKMGVKIYRLNLNYSTSVAVLKAVKSK